MSSGLLAQFCLHYAGHQTNFLPSASLLMHQNSEESVPKDEVKAEESLECSQGSGVVECSPSGCEKKPSRFLLQRAASLIKEESYEGKDQSSSSTSCSEQNFTSIAETENNFPITDIPFEWGGSPKSLAQNLTHGASTSAIGHVQYTSHDLPNSSSQELGRNPAQPRML